MEELSSLVVKLYLNLIKTMNRFFLKNLFILLSFSIIFADSNKNISAQIHIPIIQSLSLINQNNFLEVSSSDLDRGYSIIEDCVQLEIKSNTNWSLFLSANEINKNNKEKFYIKHDNSPFFPLDENSYQLMTKMLPTSGKIIDLDCKRIVDWHSTKVNGWQFLPTFKIVSTN